jgi:hypothetical protein
MLEFIAKCTKFENIYNCSSRNGKKCDSVDVKNAQERTTVNRGNSLIHC